MTLQVPGSPPARSLADILSERKGQSYLTPSVLRLYAVLIPACLIVCATNGYDGSVLNGLQAINEWKETFNSPRGALLGIISASYPLGAILSTPFSAPVSDKFGRRWCILIGSAVMIAGVILQTAGSTIGTFIGGRLVVGFGITLALAAAPVLISELAHPSHRVLFTSMYNTSFYLGSLTAAWVTYGTYRMETTWAWRLPTLLQALPALFQIAFVMFLDESPRWLCFNDRGEEAYALLVKHHCNGNTDDPLAQAEYFEIHEALQAEKEVAAIGPKLFWETPANRKRLAIIICLAVFGQWSGNGLVSYYLVKILNTIGITSQAEQTRLNGILQTVNYATGIAAAFMTTKVGRRKMFIGGGIAMLVTFSSLTASVAVYNENGAPPAAGRSALAFIFIYYTAYNICLNPLLYLYPTEVLPYRMRSMGVSILVFFNKAALFFNQFVNPIGMDSSLGWKYYLVYVAWLVVEIAVFWFLFPETQGHTLEGASKVLDRDGTSDLESEPPKLIESQHVHVEKL